VRVVIFGVKVQKKADLEVGLYDQCFRKRA